MKRTLSLFLLFITIMSCWAENPKREFRAVWVATVNNIDWPSKPGLTTEQQKIEVIELLNLHEKNGMNAIIFQVRPAADAFYKSELEPWSKYLCGKQGMMPNPFYDPLEFWIEECHKRNMEFHAWLNPFRVAQNAKEELSANHIAFKYPGWVVNYGDKLYFDPGIPEARDFVIKVVNDIVARYDIDAIHFDDYFYPYPLKNDFPDELSFAKYGSSYSSSNKGDWRRENVDRIIHSLSTNIKKTKPWVKFGISPFGVWRNLSDDPNGSDTKAGTTNYDHLYADIIKWQKNGWIDYCLPQLYWHIGHPTVDYNLLSNWWAKNSFARGMYIGNAVYKLENNSTIADWKDSNQLIKQINITRQIPGLSGNAYYSSKHFQRDLYGFDKMLRENVYKTRALIPQMPWIDNKKPETPSRIRKKGKKVKWRTGKVENEMDMAKSFVVYLNPVGQNFDINNSENIFAIVKGKEIEFKPNSRKLRLKYEIRVSALDRLQNESEISKPKVVKL